MLHFEHFIAFCDRPFQRYLRRLGLSPLSLEKMEDADFCARLAFELRIRNPSDQELEQWHRKQEEYDRLKRQSLLDDLSNLDFARRRAEARKRRDAIPLKKRVYITRTPSLDKVIGSDRKEDET